MASQLFTKFPISLFHLVSLFHPPTQQSKFLNQSKKSFSPFENMQQAEAGPSSASYAVQDAKPSAGLRTGAMAQHRVPKDFILHLESDESKSRNLVYRKAFLQSAHSRGTLAYWKIIQEPGELKEGKIRALGEENIRSRNPSAFLNRSVVSVRKRHLQVSQASQGREDAHILLARSPIVYDGSSSLEVLADGKSILTEDSGGFAIVQQLDGQIFLPPPAIGGDSFASPAPPAPSEYTVISNPKTTKKEPKNVLRALSGVTKRLPVLNLTVSFCKKLRGRMSELVGSASSSG
jgi:hypothetical protein